VNNRIDPTVVATYKNLADVSYVGVQHL